MRGRELCDIRSMNWVSFATSILYLIHKNKINKIKLPIIDREITERTIGINRQAKANEMRRTDRWQPAENSHGTV